MLDPRRFDLIVRSATTALIAVMIVCVASFEVIRTGQISSDIVGWGAIILGFYFGSHASLNGSGIRAARDQQLTAQLLGAEPPAAIHPAAKPKAEAGDGLG